MSFSAQDHRWMQLSLRMAERGLGRTWPNPSVGCVLIRDGHVVGRGITASGGRPHAETVALAMAGDAARGATAYVTLEPCSHHGQTPPCAEALIAAGIARVVVAIEDPDSRVGGRGVAMLRQAGLVVDVGCEAEAAYVQLRGHVLRQTAKRPLVSLKVASSLDGKTATAKAESRWITGQGARQFGHRLRANHDAILVGSGTVLADDPMLTCRLDGLEASQPVRVVADRRLQITPRHRLIGTAREHPTWILTSPKRAHSPEAEPLREAGADVHAAKGGIGSMLELLAGLGITRLLVEGGAELLAAFVAEGVADALWWFHAPCLLGGDGLSGVGGFPVPHLAEAPRWRLVERWAVGEDMLSYYRN